MPIKKTKVRAETSRILAETIIGPKMQRKDSQPSEDGVVAGASMTSPAQG